MLNSKKLFELMQEKEIKNMYVLSKQTKIPYSTLSYMISGHDMYVGTLIELSRFFNVPIDHLISKSYGIATYSENGIIFNDTSSFVEAAVSSWM
ncbi:MAG: helix-turn-helix transcriptional regulator [Bacilli bacterium]|nr:helix-turn-helix transcriptional regulator [Bacilli bacterium]